MWRLQSWWPASASICSTPRGAGTRRATSAPCAATPCRAASGSTPSTRACGALRREEWPLSFGLEAVEPGVRQVRVRLRAYVEEAVRDYRGAQPWPPPYAPPPIAATIEALCANAATLPPYEERLLRQGPAPVTTYVK